MHQHDYVGILVSDKMHRGIPKGHTAQESLILYETSARMYGMIPVFLRISDVDSEKGASTVYLYNGGEYKRTIVPTPSVIHNRAIYVDRSSSKRLHKLNQQGIRIFNSNNRYGKEEIHSLLAGDSWIREQLPISQPATFSSILLMMEHYDDLILKPTRGSIGKGIYRLKRDNRGWRLNYSIHNKRITRKEVRLSQGSLPTWLRKQIQTIPYLVQERLPLAEVDGRPFDLRVTVQRGENGEWGVTGIYAKLAASGKFLSNIAQGASAYPADQLLRQVFSPPAVYSILTQARALSLAVALQLSMHLPLLADLGMDIGVTSEGSCYFIECNGRDQRYGFRKAGMTSIWAETYRKPMAFARYLLETSSSMNRNLQPPH